jgi:acetyl/propionyl-CoA carboxylase alpha subunit
VRDDSGVFEGFEIPIYYDPIISKLVVWGKNRAEAVARMRRALNEYVVTGVKTTIPFHIRVMKNRHFLEGDFDTNFIDKVFFKEEDERRLEHADVAMISAAIQLFLDERKRAMAQRPPEAAGPVSMWKYSARPGMRKLG